MNHLEVTYSLAADPRPEMSSQVYEERLMCAWREPLQSGPAEPDVQAFLETHPSMVPGAHFWARALQSERPRTISGCSDYLAAAARADDANAGFSLDREGQHLSEPDFRGDRGPGKRCSMASVTAKWPHRAACGRCVAGAAITEPLPHEVALERSIDLRVGGSAKAWFAAFPRGVRMDI